MGESNRKDEIHQIIAKARVAILLITADFLTIEFILNEEIPGLLNRRSRNEDLIIFPIIAKACAWKTMKWLDPMEVRPQGSRPIWGNNSELMQSWQR